MAAAVELYDECARLWSFNRCGDLLRERGRHETWSTKEAQANAARVRAACSDESEAGKS